LVELSLVLRLLANLTTGSEEGLEPQANLVLRFLLGFGPRRPSELADGLYMQASTCSKLISRMETQGLVTRECDPEDRRARCVCLTTEGRDVANQLLSRAANMSDEIMEEWTDEEIAQFDQFAARIIESGYEILQIANIANCLTADDEA
jgi:DNA-binding MarR family transcriptional regulator